jgi:hypothetical protein
MKLGVVMKNPPVERPKTRDIYSAARMLRATGRADATRVAQWIEYEAHEADIRKEARRLGCTTGYYRRNILGGKK